MSDARPEITRDQLLAYAHDRGADLSPHQLVRWHKAGLLPRPRRVHLGRGKGTTSVYPRYAADLAIVLDIARRQRRDVQHMAWAGWASGFPLTPKVRELLAQHFARRVEAARTTLDAFESDNPDNAIDRARDRPLGKGLEHVPRDLRSTAALLMTDVQLGRLDFGEYNPRDLLTLFSRTSKPLAIDPHDAKEFFDWIAHAFEPLNAHKAVEALRRLSDAQLETDRAIALDIWRTVWRGTPGEPPVLSFGVFEAVFLMRRASKRGRWLIAWFRRGLRAQGFASFADAFEHAKRIEDAKRQS